MLRMIQLDGAYLTARNAWRDATRIHRASHLVDGNESGLRRTFAAVPVAP